MMELKIAAGLAAGEDGGRRVMLFSSGKINGVDERGKRPPTPHHNPAIGGRAAMAISDSTLDDEPVRFGTTTRWKGRQLLTRAEKLERQRALARKWRATNRERVREYFRGYRAAHPELKAKQGRYYRQHIDKWKARPNEDPARRRARNANNRPHINAVWREWNQKNPDRARAIELRHRKRRRARKRVADREYRRSRPDVYKAGIARAKAKKPGLYKEIRVKSSLVRRARKRALPVERVSLRQIVVRDRSRCHLCVEDVSRADRSFDHLIPVVRGGAFAEWNLMVAHLVCNKRRGTKQILSDETREAAEAYIAARTATAETVA